LFQAFGKAEHHGRREWERKATCLIATGKQKETERKESRDKIYLSKAHPQ
jgi:hypothetical protein